MSQTQAEKSSQTYSIDWNNIHSECPCCHSQIKVDFKFGPQPVQVSLVPVNKPPMNPIQSPGTNSSLMNIVSVESGSERNFSSRDQIISLSFNSMRSEDENSSEVNESTSSSVSNNSHSRGSHLEPIVQITTAPDLPSSKVPFLAPGQFSSGSSSYPNQDVRMKCQFLGRFLSCH